MINSWKKALTVSIVSTLALSSNVWAEKLPGEGVTVQALQSTVAEETFQTSIVNRALEELGYDVQPTKEVDYNVAYTSIAKGDATFLAVGWFPLHADKYKISGGDDKFYRQGQYVSGAAQGYLIDKKTAEKYGITNIGQLKDPKVAKLFDANGDGKADLTGCNPGWGCEMVIEHHLGAYQLEDTVTHNQGNYAAIIANKEFAAQNPAAAKLFEIIKLNINDVSAQNMMMSKGKNSSADIESHVNGWIKANRPLFNSWLAEAKKAAI